MKRFGIVSLFPEMFHALTWGVTGRALTQEIIDLSHYNPRDFTEDLHHSVDDRPYGGGPGMVMLAEPLMKAISAAKNGLGEASRVIYLSPQGKRVDHNAIMRWAEQNDPLVLVCGRYEGIDERVLDLAVDEVWSLGDYVLSGGELAAMVLIDAISRQLPGALGHSESAVEESFVAGLLDCPHYTRPEIYEDRSVPSVLLSGHHAVIRRWRLQQALGRTWQYRPDLLVDRALSEEEQALLAAFIAEATPKQC